MKITIVILAVLAFSEGFHQKINVPSPLKNERIVGGSEAPPHAFPHQVAVISNVGFCGGSLISKTTVMTAAHCTQGADEFRVYLGAHDLNEDEPERIEITTKNFTVHENYSKPMRLENDISLIYLPEPVELSPYVKIVDLPKQSDVENDFDGYPSRMSGWGATQDGSSSSVLKYINTYIISNEECKKAYGSYLKDTNICTSWKNEVSTCNGDSGGPLITYQGDRMFQIGIASFVVNGSGCKGYPQGYNRVTKYLDWIKIHSDADIQ